MKNLVIVGNQIDLKNDFSNFINNADYVIRFNRLDNFNKNTGFKTNELFCRNNEKGIWGFDNENNFLFNDIIDLKDIRLSFVSKNLTDDIYSKSFNIVKKNNLSNINIVNSTNLEKIKKGGSPSTGLICLEYVLQSKLYTNYNIFLVGFNWKNDKTNIGHTWKLERTRINNYHKKNILTLIEDTKENFYKYCFLNNDIENKENNEKVFQKIYLEGVDIKNIYDKETFDLILKFYNILNDKLLFENLNTLKRKFKLKIKNLKLLSEFMSTYQNLYLLNENYNLYETFKNRVNELSKKSNKNDLSKDTDEQNNSSKDSDEQLQNNSSKDSDEQNDSSKDSDEQNDSSKDSDEQLQNDSSKDFNEQLQNDSSKDSNEQLQNDLIKDESQEVSNDKQLTDDEILDNILEKVMSKCTLGGCNHDHSNKDKNSFLNYVSDEENINLIKNESEEENSLNDNSVLSLIKNIKNEIESDDEIDYSKVSSSNC